jgi:hypothetical protein
LKQRKTDAPRFGKRLAPARGNLKKIVSYRFDDQVDLARRCFISMMEPRTMLINPDELLPPDTVAAELHLRRETLTSWRANGRGPNFVKVGRAVFYRRADLAEWLGAQHRQPVKNRLAASTA